MAYDALAIAIHLGISAMIVLATFQSCWRLASAISTSWRVLRDWIDSDDAGKSDDESFNVRHSELAFEIFYELVDQVGSSSRFSIALIPVSRSASASRPPSQKTASRLREVIDQCFEE